MEFQNKCVPLHSQLGNENYFNKGLRLRNGSVAQLNRASDYGSEGYGFESRRSHKRFHENYKGIKIEKEDVIHLTSSFSVYARHEYYLTGASPE